MRTTHSLVPSGRVLGLSLVSLLLTATAAVALPSAPAQRALEYDVVLALAPIPEQSGCASRAPSASKLMLPAISFCIPPRAWCASTSRPSTR